MNNIDNLRKEKGILVAAHRGVAGANIPCNTIPAFDIALKEGADILEMDLIRTIDGEIFIFHTGKEPFQLDRHINLCKLTANEVRNLKLVNVDFAETEWGLNTFDEILERYKGKCILNLDKSIDILDSVVEKVNKHNMQDQILLKSDPDMKSLKMIENYASDYMYMPILKNIDNGTEIIDAMNINYIGAELVFSSEDVEVAKDSFIYGMHKKGKILWGNGILYDSKVPLSAGHSDDISMIDNPDKGWGWLAEKGFDIIQTDWTSQCKRYLQSIDLSK